MGNLLPKQDLMQGAIQDCMYLMLGQAMQNKGNQRMCLSLAHGCP